MVIATDHYLELIQTLTQQMQQLGFSPRVIGYTRDTEPHSEPSHTLSVSTDPDLDLDVRGSGDVLVMNSALVGSVKATRDFWDTLKNELPGRGQFLDKVSSPSFLDT